jgi:hypothetical protein
MAKDASAARVIMEKYSSLVEDSARIPPDEKGILAGSSRWLRRGGGS